ncbi:MAG: Xaa-Pro peptidase family protein [Chloroflexota bacterium]|nr:Xaa-Pro peptidase family protein [Chloroflexota bacterium]
MKEDLDRLMQVHQLDAIVVSGPVHNNPALYYLTQGAGLMNAHVIKKRGEAAILIANPLEREEALKSGLQVVVNSHYDYQGLFQKYAGDRLATAIAYLQRIFAEQQIIGRVGFYGLREQGAAYTFLSALDKALPEIEVVGEFERDLFQAARATKSEEEAQRIREVGRRTTEVVRETVAFLQNHAVAADETLQQADGSVLAVGDVHAQIRRLIANQGLEDPAGFIFSTGRDAGIPHSKGTVAKPIRLGESIVFDIFPREPGGGYFFDMTRTFSLGYVPEPLAQIYQDTQDCLAEIIPQLAVGEETRHYQAMTCACYQKRGHPTIATERQTTEGYIHSLGHGVGLNLHELPFFSDTPTNVTQLQPGHVFTIEPGLYYPERGMGCRIEDVYWIDAAGQVNKLTNYPYELVIPMKS